MHGFKPCPASVKHIIHICHIKDLSNYDNISLVENDNINTDICSRQIIIETSKGINLYKRLGPAEFRNIRLGAATTYQVKYVLYDEQLS